VEDNGNAVRVYDKQYVPIYTYRNLISVPTGAAPYEDIPVQS
jgi:hypothetical protein